MSNNNSRGGLGGAGRNAFFPTEPKFTPEPPSAAPEVEELSFEDKPVAKTVVSPEPKKQPRKKPDPIPAMEPDEEREDRFKSSFNLSDASVTALERIKTQYRRQNKKRTTYGALLDEAVELLAKKYGVSL